MLLPHAIPRRTMSGLALCLSSYSGQLPLSAVSQSRWSGIGRGGVLGAVGVSRGAGDGGGPPGGEQVAGGPAGLLGRLQTQQQLRQVAGEAFSRSRSTPKCSTNSPDSDRRNQSHQTIGIGTIIDPSLVGLPPYRLRLFSFTVQC